MASSKKIALLITTLLIYTSAILISDDIEDSFSKPMSENLPNDDDMVVEEESYSSEDIEFLKLQLLDAASKGDLTSMESVVRKVCNDLIECPSMTTLLQEGDASGNTALHLAVTSGSVEAVKFLLQYGALIDAHAHNPMNMACIVGQSDIVDNLVHSWKKQTVNLRNSFGNTPLTLATRAGYLDVVKILAPYSDSDSLYDSVVTAAEQGNMKIAKAILGSGICMEHKKLLKAFAIIWEDLSSNMNFLFTYMTFLHDLFA